MPKRRKLVLGCSRQAHNQPASAVGSPEAACQGTLTKSKGYGAFRFWFDERRFKGPGSVCVVHEALYASGGVRTGGYPKAAPCPGPLGFQRMGDWDLLWTPARLALKAAPVIKPGQLICACPGLMSLSRKRKLPCTLHEALGPAAWAVMPRSFTLPDDLPALKAHMEARCAAGAGDELWILKTAQHLGKGLKLLPARELYDEAVKRPRLGTKPYVMAQQYVDNPLLIEGRKFGIRVWVVVLGPDPLRAYLHVNGLVLFANNEYNSNEWLGSGGSVALGHVTNYAQNVDGMVWDLQQLEAHLGQQQFHALWDRISRSAALICSAALGNMRADAAALQLPPESTFEVLGLDYLVDTQLHPWLLEVNGTPSLAVDHQDPQVEARIRTQKAGMCTDLFQLLGVSTRFKARYEAMRLAAKQATARKQGTAVGSRTSSAGGSGSLASDARASADDDGDDEDKDAAAADDAADDEDEAVAAGGGASKAAAAAGAAHPAAGKPQPGVATAVVLPKRLRDQLAPKSDAAVQARVARELQERGGWQPLMCLFPMSPAQLQPGVQAAGCSGPGQPPHISNGRIMEQELQPTMTSITLAAGEAAHANGGMDGLLYEAHLTAKIPWAQRDLELRRVLDAVAGAAAGTAATAAAHLVGLDD